ncbi:MAG: hypothetical protein IJ812_09730 [Schwartzia sp.]|nr:hypothetical protein [Schwartzia sp. (in: firmicutes)]
MDLQVFTHDELGSVRVLEIDGADKGVTKCDALFVYDLMRADGNLPLVEQ